MIDEEEQSRRETLLNEVREGSMSKIVDRFEVNHLKPENYEPVPQEVARLELANKFLKISNLQKKYPNGFQAVKGLNMKMYQGQIFALLGQNGAGKTTTISMLTGLIGQSSGKATVFDKEVFE